MTVSGISGARAENSRCQFVTSGFGQTSNTRIVNRTVYAPIQVVGASQQFNHLRFIGNVGIEIVDFRTLFEQFFSQSLAEMSIHLPPLRERSGDAVALARVFVTRYAEQLKRPVKGLAADAIALIARHSWPGNVREMENRLKRAVLMADGHYVTARDLNINDDGAIQQNVALNLRDVREKAESRAIRCALQLSGNNIAAAARQLGITRPTLYSLLEKYQIRAE